MGFIMVYSLKMDSSARCRLLLDVRQVAKSSLKSVCRLPVFYWLADDAAAELPDGVPNHWVWILS